MCALAHVFEAAGLATVSLIAVKPVAERIRPPRALYCEFPLGRPLGKPNEPAYQRRVIDAAFALLDRPSGPVLETFPDVIESEVTEAVACRLPPRHDPDLHPAVDEAQALRGAYDRAVAKSGRTSVGRVVEPDGVPGAIEAFARVAGGTPWNEAGIPGIPIETAHDIRSYYEELCVELAGGAPAAWAAEHWFYEETEAGRTLIAARKAMQEGGAPFPLWFYLAPAARPNEVGA